MRIIDADELEKKMYHEAFEVDSELQMWNSGCWIRYKLFEKCLENTPTIDAADRPQGEWVYGEHDVAMCDGYRCDRCGFFVPWDYEHKSIDFINDYNFCPSCGARMK